MKMWINIDKSLELTSSDIFMMSKAPRTCAKRLFFPQSRKNNLMSPKTTCGIVCSSNNEFLEEGNSDEGLWSFLWLEPPRTRQTSHFDLVDDKVGLLRRQTSLRRTSCAADNKRRCSSVLSLGQDNTGSVKEIRDKDYQCEK